MTDTAVRSAASAAGTQTLHRAASLLRIITSHNRAGVRLVDLYRKAGLERPTAHRILQGLIAEQLVRQDQASRRYHLSPRVYEMGLAATPPLALRDICKPHLDELAERSGELAYFTLRSGMDGVCVARAEGAHALPALVHDVGRHRPLNVGASGIALLSALPDDEMRRVCRANAARTRQKDPRFDEATLHDHIAATRRRGFSLIKVLDAPVALSIGLAMRFADGTPAAGVSLAGPASRLTDTRIGELVAMMRNFVVAIERELELVQAGRQVQ